MGIMGRLIRETYDHIQHKHAEKFERRRELAAKKDGFTKRIKAATDEEKKEKLKKQRHQIAEKLVGVRKQINDRPIRATKYLLEIRGADAYDKFIDRCEAVGWGADAPPCTVWIYEQKRKRAAWAEQELAGQLSRQQSYKRLDNDTKC